jgi:hypothetical protein
MIRMSYLPTHLTQAVWPTAVWPTLVGCRLLLC